MILVVGCAVFFGYYLPRKERVECDRLRECHGAPYERYEAAVPALFPTFRPYRDFTPASWTVERMIRNREYWMVIGLLGVTAYLLWRAMNV